jgi:glyoxylase I family protein
MTSPSFVDHLVYRVAALGRTERFYTALLGEPSFSNEDAVAFTVGDTRLFFTPASGLGAHDKEAIGLNHLALGVRTPEQLKAMETKLNGAGIKNSGIKLDPDGKKDYIWFDDPDGFRVEFYLREA